MIFWNHLLRLPSRKKTSCGASNWPVEVKNDLTFSCMDSNPPYERKALLG